MTALCRLVGLGILLVLVGCAREEPAVLGSFRAESSFALRDVLASPGDFLQRDVTVGGKVGEVCRVAGCWLELSQGDENLHVELLGFRMSTRNEGRSCRVQGKLMEKEGRWTLLARGISFED